MPPTLVTVGELAAYLKSTPASLYRALRLGKLHGVKVGTQWRIDLEELQNSLVAQVDVTKLPSTSGAGNAAEKTVFEDIGQPARKRGRSHWSIHHRPE